GGFGRRTLEPWGEAATKAFVHEAVAEALKLERALARLRTPQRVALLHYAPIEGTVEGEPREIFPFLGSSRLEEPLNRYQVTVAFHGHAHRGAPEGRTSAGIPVFNVAMPLLRRVLSDTLPVRIVEIPALMPVSAGAEAPSRRRDGLHERIRRAPSRSGCGGGYHLNMKRKRAADGPRWPAPFLAGVLAAGAGMVLVNALFGRRRLVDPRLIRR